MNILTEEVLVLVVFQFKNQNVVQKLINHLIHVFFGMHVDMYHNDKVIKLGRYEPNTL